MGYVQKSLGKDEKILKEFEVHWIPYVLGAFAALFIVGIPFLLSLIMSERALTSSRVVNKTGFIARRTAEMKLSKVENIRFSQGILGRILGYGHVEISGTGSGIVLFGWVKSPISVKREIEDHLPNG